MVAIPCVVHLKHADPPHLIANPSGLGVTAECFLMSHIVEMAKVISDPVLGANFFSVGYGHKVRVFLRGEPGGELCPCSCGGVALVVQGFIDCHREVVSFVVHITSCGGLLFQESS